MERNDFESQWQRRQQAMRQAQTDAPNDEILLRMAQVAREQIEVNPEGLDLTRRRFRWVPYAAAACVLIALSLISLRWMGDASRFPVAKEVRVEGQTIRFLCNSDCSADDVVHSAQQILIK